MTQLEKHEKAIRILENIEICKRQIDSIKYGLIRIPFEFRKWSNYRVETYGKMILKLQRYYDNNFKL